MRRVAVHTAIFGLLGVLGLAFGTGYWGYVKFKGPGPLASERTVVIAKGTGLERIGKTLAAEGVIADQLLFKLGARLTGRGRSMRAGEYAIPAGISMDGVIALLVEGKTVKRWVTVPEGLTTHQVLDLVAAADGLTGEVPAAVDEGRLLPETYDYALGESRKAVVRRMRAAMDKMLASLWETRSSSIAVRTPEEALALSSIIERETGVDSERARVSAVFHNRLRLGMRLQSDPTVAYALTEGKSQLDRPLTFHDLKIDSPFNTYRVRGLPPRPIANPGRASIEAALNPADGKELYFVADGTGGHVFSRTLAQHNRNVAKWRRIQRERRRQKPAR